MANSFYRANAAAFVVALWLPVLQLCSGVLPARPLGGVEALPPAKAERSLANWHSGTLQAEAEWHMIHDLGLRDWMIRIDNQISWSLFGVVKKPVVKGSDGWLYLDDWLPDRDLLMPEFRDQTLVRLWNLRRLQDVLDQHGIRLATVISPGKARLYPEHLPARQRAVAASGLPTVYSTFRAAAAAAHLRLCDFQEVFERWKAAVPEEPLFTRLGGHWSNHAGARAAVYLLDEIERTTGLDVKNLDVAGSRVRSVAEGMDDDLLRMANLLDEGSLREETLATELTPRPGDAGRPLRLLMVGTSFLWNLAGPLSRYGAAAPLTLLYYYKSRYEDEAGELQPKQPIDSFRSQLREQLGRYDVIVVENQSIGMLGLGMGFVDEALRAFGEEPATVLPPEAAEWLRGGPK